jgi:hypothetical protein
VKCLWRQRYAQNVLLATAGNKRPFRRPGKRADNNIKMPVKGTVWMGMNWINLDQDKDNRWPFVNMVMNIQVLENAGNISNG